MPLGSFPPGEGPLLAAIERSGMLGITSKQLATTTGRPLSEVESTLGRLSGRARVLRVGKGLWIVPRFAGEPAGGEGFLGPEWYLDRFLREAELPAATAYSGEIQFNPNEELPVHRWWPYVQGFSADFVRGALRTYGIRRGATVLDPFSGSGTVSVEARLAGAQAVAVELMPVAASVIRAKHAWSVSPLALRRAGDDLVRRARVTAPGAPPFLRETRRQFSPGALSTLLRLRAALAKVRQGEVRSLLELSFASILVASSRLKRSPCLGYARKPEVGPEGPYELFRLAVERMATDLTTLREMGKSLGPPAQVLERNARTLPMKDEVVDLAITSPPYVNGMDYVMNYKLEMAWLGQARSYEDLSRLKSDMVACDNVSPVTIGAYRPGPLIEGDEWLQGILQDIRRNIASKSVYRRRDMADIVAKYFDDLVPVIGSVHRVLRPGGRFLVVNGDSLMAGTYVPGDLIFGRLAEKVGFEVERLEMARERRSGQRRDFRLRESILTLRKPLSS